MKFILSCLICLSAGFLAGLYFPPASNPLADGLPSMSFSFEPPVPAAASVRDAPVVEVIAGSAPEQPLEEVLPEEVIYRAHDDALIAVDQLLGGAIRTESMERTRASVARLGSALQLAADQEARILSVAERFMDANPLPLPVEADAFDSPLRPEIESVLRPDQLAAYDELRERSRLNWVESQAYGEMARLQGAGSHTEAEKDALFAQLVEDFAAGSGE